MKNVDMVSLRVSPAGGTRTERRLKTVIFKNFQFPFRAPVSLKGKISFSSQIYAECEHGPIAGASKCYPYSTAASKARY